MATGTAATAARKRAREQRMKIDAAQVAREQRIEDAATEFFVASDELEKAAARADAAKARAVKKLAGDGESQERIAALLDIDPDEARRLARLGESGRRPARTASTEGSGHEQGETAQVA